MASKVFPLRASEEERQAWQRAAESAGVSFNAWARRALNDQAALDAALRREVSKEEGRNDEGGDRASG